jgi:hypothetical protein
MQFKDSKQVEVTFAGRGYSFSCGVYLTEANQESQLIY